MIKEAPTCGQHATILGHAVGRQVSLRREQKLTGETQKRCTALGPPRCSTVQAGKPPRRSRARALGPTNSLADEAACRRHGRPARRLQSRDSRHHPRRRRHGCAFHVLTSGGSGRGIGAGPCRHAFLHRCCHRSLPRTQEFRTVWSGRPGRAGRPGCIVRLDSATVYRGGGPPRWLARRAWHAAPSRSCRQVRAPDCP